MEIETLTDAEREELNWPMPNRAQPKALRIIDAQAAEIARLRDAWNSARAACLRAEAERDSLLLLQGRAP